MKRRAVFLGLFLVLTTTASAQIGKSVSVAAGTPEDKDLAAIYAAPDGPEKIALLDKFMADHGTGDLALLGDQLYAQTYLAQKNYAKVYEYGDKAMALDPDDFSALILMVHAADEQGDAQKIYALGEKAEPLLERYKASPAPVGMSEDQWSAQKAQNLKDAQADINYVQYAMVNAAYKTKDLPPRIQLLERFAKTFPDSQYTLAVREQTAIAYQQAQNTPEDDRDRAEYSHEGSRQHFDVASTRRQLERERPATRQSGSRCQESARPAGKVSKARQCPR